MSAVRFISSLRIIATIGALLIAGAHEYLIAVCSFSVPYIFAVLFDNLIAERFGLLIIAFLGCYLLVCCVSQILIRINYDTANIVGLCFIIAMSASDIVCSVLSCVENFAIAKIVNIILSVSMLVLSYYQIKKIRGQGDGLREP